MIRFVLTAVHLIEASSSRYVFVVMLFSLHGRPLSPTVALGTWRSMN